MRTFCCNTVAHSSRQFCTMLMLIPKTLAILPRLFSTRHVYYSTLQIIAIPFCIFCMSKSQSFYLLKREIVFVDVPEQRYVPKYLRVRTKHPVTTLSELKPITGLLPSDYIIRIIYFHLYI